MNYCFNNAIKKELLSVGVSLDNFQDACVWLNENKYHENEVLSETAHWFFFSQFIFIVASKKEEFKHKKIKAQKNDFFLDVSPLAYVLILYSMSELIPEAISITLGGIGTLEQKEEPLDSLLKDFVGNSSHSLAWKDAQSFIFNEKKYSNRKKIEKINGMPIFEFLGTLKKMKIPISRFIFANKNHSVYKEANSQRLRKSALYWKNVFAGLLYPGKISTEGEGEKTLLLIQGNLPNSVFVLMHYTLLWEKKKERNGEAHAKGFFAQEIYVLGTMLDVYDKVTHRDSIEGIYQIFGAVLKKEEFMGFMSDLMMAIEFHKNES